MRVFCKELLARAKAYAPSIPPGLSSHLTMTLIALERIGATEAHMRQYFYLCTQRLQPVTEATLIISEENFDSYLGHVNNYAAYADFFEKEIREKGIENVLQSYVEKLAPSLGAASFHPLIRLGYAINLLDEELEIAHQEIAISLAYLASAFYSFGEISGEPSSVQTQVEKMHGTFVFEANCA